MTRHLIDKETAIKDMVTDFANQGNRIVERYEKAQQEYFDLYKANNDQRHQNLVKMFEKAEADVAATSKAVAKGHVQKMHEQWKTRQEVLMRKMAAAFAACAE